MISSSKSLGIIFAATLFIAFLLEQILFPPSKNLYQQLVAASSAQEDDIALARTILGSISRMTHDERGINVNGNYDGNRINAVLIDFDSVDRERFHLPKEGMIALPPNVLLIDTKMFHSILLQAFNDLTYFEMMSNEMDNLKSIAEAGIVGEKFGALSWQLRLINLSHRELTDHPFGSMISPELRNLTPPNFQENFALPFVFPISHELYHLRPRTFFGLNTLEEEINADKFALSIAHNFFSNSKMPANFQEVFRKQLLFIGLRYFQDRLLAEIFHGFRGIDADSIFPVLIHTKCNQTISKIPWPRRFNNPDSIALGELRGLPVLSDDDVALISTRLDESARRDHEHLLRRIVRFADMVSNDKYYHDSAVAFDLSRNLLSIYENKRAKMEMFYRDTLPKPRHIQIHRLLNRLHVKIQPISAIDCDNGKCSTGSVGNGHVEILGANNKIALLTLIQPNNVEGIAATIATLEEFMGRKNARNSAAQFFTNLKTCSVASSLIETSDYFIVVRLMNTDGWIEVRATAN